MVDAIFNQKKIRSEWRRARPLPMGMVCSSPIHQPHLYKGTSTADLRKLARHDHLTR